MDCFLCLFPRKDNVLYPAFEMTTNSIFSAVLFVHIPSHLKDAESWSKARACTPFLTPFVLTTLPTLVWHGGDINPCCQFMSLLKSYHSVHSHQYAHLSWAFSFWEELCNICPCSSIIWIWLKCSIYEEMLLVGSFSSWPTHCSSKKFCEWTGKEGNSH